jgi:hypothetical protein
MNTAMARAARRELAVVFGLAACGIALALLVAFAPWYEPAAAHNAVAPPAQTTVTQTTATQTVDSQTVDWQTVDTQIAVRRTTDDRVDAIVGTSDEIAVVVYYEP